jgi:exosome complex RNA-binding protein Rrp4
MVQGLKTGEGDILYISIQTGTPVAQAACCTTGMGTLSQGHICQIVAMITHPI